MFGIRVRISREIFVFVVGLVQFSTRWWTVLSITRIQEAALALKKGSWRLRYCLVSKEKRIQIK